jgi:hypothetical protein
MALLCVDCVDGLDPDDSDEDSTIDNETVVSQHKDSLYYSECDEEEIVEEGRSKICHQKENLDFLQTVYRIMTMFQIMGKTLKCLKFCSAK